MKSALSLLLLVALFSCTAKEKVDLVYHHGVVYTVDGNFSTAQAFAVKDGKFVAVGTNEEVLYQYDAEQIIDGKGLPVYPGFNDAHSHFYRYGLGLQDVDLTGTSSFDEIVALVVAHRKKYPEADWIFGRGWDQNDWEIKEFPTKDTLDRLFPDAPVLLTRVDGHAALVNQKALDLAGIDATTNIPGGKIVLAAGQPTGLLVDNAIDQVSGLIEAPDSGDQAAALLAAQQNCFEVGITSLADAGLDKSTIDIIDSLQKEGSLKMRIYAMLNPTETNREHYFTSGPYKSDFLNVRSFKIYGDGALGSRGACLLEPYHDDADNYGFLLASVETYRSLAKEIAAHDFQMNTHCIGDSANRIILQIYSEVLQPDNAKRWRIEHAQVVSNEDIRKFAAYKVIPSVQPTHATSDMYWAGDRLNQERLKAAYAYKDLLQTNGMLALGSDFPVESINPLYGFHAAVARQDDQNFPNGGFQPENKISREDALKGMTIWAAYAAFEENEKGSIEPGKMADFVVLEKDIMKEKEASLRTIKVAETFIDGKKVF